MTSTLYRNLAITDARSDRLRLDMSVLVDGHHIDWIRPAGDEPRLGPDTEVVDAGGSTLIPGMVDAPPSSIKINTPRFPCWNIGPPLWIKKP